MGLSRNSLHQKITSTLREEIFTGILASGSFTFNAARKSTYAVLAMHTHLKRLLEALRQIRQ